MFYELPKSLKVIFEVSSVHRLYEEVQQSIATGSQHRTQEFVSKNHGESGCNWISNRIKKKFNVSASYLVV